MPVFLQLAMDRMAPEVPKTQKKATLYMHEFLQLAMGRMAPEVPTAQKRAKRYMPVFLQLAPDGASTISLPRLPHV